MRQRLKPERVASPTGWQVQTMEMSNPALSADSAGVQSSSPPEESPPVWPICLAGVALVLAGWIVYSNSFSGEFAQDGEPSILQNPTIRQGWWEALHPPLGTATVSGRPLVNLSLALNYHLGGLTVWGYHLFNLVIQLLAGLTLFGLVRRTLERPGWRGRYRMAALPLAFVIALLWTIHPLQTEAVTYVIQRAESMMGLFYLLTLYCFVRAMESSRPGTWFALSVLSCLLGMVTKEVMVTAPLLVWLYDRTFVAGTFARAWRQRWKFHAALAGTWLPLAYLVVTVSWPGNASMNSRYLGGVSPVMKSSVYALKQCDVISQYLGLAFWPHPLVSDYGNQVATDPLSLAPSIMLLTLLVGGTLYALWRKPALGFVGTWFFVILAPTSSIVPQFSEPMADRRLYLSLAAALVLLVLGLHAMLGRRAYIAYLALALGLGGLTYERNRDYRTGVSISADAVEKRPDNPDVYDHLGLTLMGAGRLLEALGCYETLGRLVPGKLGPEAETNLGNVLFRLGRFNNASTHYQNALQMNPGDWEVEFNLGCALYALGKSDEAIPHLLQATKLNPGFAPAYHNLGNAYLQINQPKQALDAFTEAAHLDPANANTHNNLANLYLLVFGRTDEAIAEFQAALRADPRHDSAYSGLAKAYLQTNRPADAIPQLEAVIRLKPDSGEAYLSLGDALLAVGRINDAIPQYETAVRLMPDNAAARDHLEKARPLAQPSAPPLNGTKQ